MGNPNSRVIQYSRISHEFSKCQFLQARKCHIYGQVNFVRHNQTNFYLAQSQKKVDPPLNALHYLVKPDLLLVPEFTLFEDFKPTSLQILLKNLKNICEMCEVGVGLGYGKIANVQSKWGIVGQKEANWYYSKALQGHYDSKWGTCYVSPKMMLSLSQNKKVPRHNLQKSDVFILGIMTIEILFNQKLGSIFNFPEFQIKLKPILLKLNKIQKYYGSAVYQLFLGMVQIEEEYRFCFTEVRKQITLILETQIEGKSQKKDANKFAKPFTVKNQNQNQYSYLEDNSQKSRVPSFILDRQNQYNTTNNSRKSQFSKPHGTGVSSKERSFTSRGKQKSHSIQKAPQLFQHRENRTHSFYRTPKKSQSILNSKKNQEKQKEIINDFSPFKLSLSSKESENQSINKAQNYEYEHLQIKFTRNNEGTKANPIELHKNTSKSKIPSLAMASPKKHSKQIKFHQTLDDYSPIQLR